MSAKILVSDTNIWIDLHRSGLLEAVFRLPHHFVTTDFVWRELRQPPGTKLKELGLAIEVIDGQGVQTLFQLRRSLNNSSLADVSCYLVAREKGWTLLTGDGALRKSGQRANLEVRGTLWLLDELERHQIKTGQELAEALEQMLNMGARLPMADCRLRLNKWRAG